MLAALAGCLGDNTAATLGNLEIDITAPPGVTPSVHVASYNIVNNSQTWDLSASKTLEAMPSGFYLITTSTVSGPGGDYVGMPLSQNAKVLTGMTAKVSVTYEPAGPAVYGEAKARDPGSR